MSCTVLARLNFKRFSLGAVITGRQGLAIPQVNRPQTPTPAPTSARSAKVPPTLTPGHDKYNSHGNVCVCGGGEDAHGETPGVGVVWGGGCVNKTKTLKFI